MNEAIVIVLAVLCVFMAGFSAGKQFEQKRHLEQEAEYATLVQNLREENQKQTQEHNKQQADRKAELEALRYVYEARIDSLTAEYNNSLLDSEARSTVYRERECAAPVGDTGLVEHAARLDRAVVEGRALVTELTEALRQCELTYEKATGYLLNDRSFLDGTTTR